MNTWHYEYDNSIRIDFYDNEGDLEIIRLIEDALMGRAKAALDKDDAEAAIRELRSLTELEEKVQKMMRINDEKEAEDE